jgi:hypothetical protein
MEYVDEKLCEVLRDSMTRNHWLATLWTPMGDTLHAAMNEALDDGYRVNGTTSARSVADQYQTLL